MLSILTKTYTTCTNTKKFLEMIDIFSTLAVVMVSQVRHTSKRLKKYSLNVCNIVYINYTLIKIKT